MTVVDASVLVALCDGADPQHSRARRELDGASLAVTGGTLEELIRVVRRRANLAGVDGNIAGRRALTQVLTLGLRQAPTIAFEDVEPIYSKHAVLSWVDAWNLAAAAALEESLATFDRDLAKIARRTGVP